MKISEFKKSLSSSRELNFLLPNGIKIPNHFHVTEVGLITKHFIDCGGTIRNEKVANIQLWSANDTDHKLVPEKLLKIITSSEKLLGTEDHEIEVEYQKDTIGKYGLSFDGKNFMLTAKQATCLANDSCGISKETHNTNPSGQSQCHIPDSECC